MLLLGIFLVTGILAGIFFNYRYWTGPAEKPVPPEETGATLTITRFEHTAMKDGETHWTLKADSAKLFSENRKAGLHHVETEFFTDDGERIRMRADKGEMDMAAKNIRAWNHVVVTHPEYRLTTETLNYHYDSRIMIIDAPLEIAGDGMLFRADSGYFEMDSQTARFEGNVEGWFNERILP